MGRRGGMTWKDVGGQVLDPSRGIGMGGGGVGLEKAYGTNCRDVGPPAHTS